MRLLGRRAMIAAAAISVAIGAAAGCQLIGGFEDFTSADAGADGGDGSCAPPLVDGGPKMVSQALAKGCVWIDSSEVTVADYKAFLATMPAGQPTGCEAKDGGYAPDPTCLGDAGLVDDTLPITCVDWCDAERYCASVGKRLCKGEPSQPATSEWLAACSDDGDRTYPYGNTPNDQTCNISGQTAAVASYSGCKAACGAFDMAGNVKEWVNECPNSTSCLLRGGGAGDSDPTCDVQTAAGRLTFDAFRGFRCCADPEQR